MNKDPVRVKTIARMEKTMAAQLDAIEDRLDEDRLAIRRLKTIYRNYLTLHSQTFDQVVQRNQEMAARIQDLEKQVVRLRHQRCVCRQIGM